MSATRLQWIESSEWAPSNQPFCQASPRHRRVRAGGASAAAPRAPRPPRSVRPPPPLESPHRCPLRPRASFSVSTGRACRKLPANTLVRASWSDHASLVAALTQQPARNAYPLLQRPCLVSLRWTRVNTMTRRPTTLGCKTCRQAVPSTRLGLNILGAHLRDDRALKPCACRYVTPLG